ncbi:MAG TPA: hypothetical protein VGD63_22185 [Steroidobacteraceae bacterium]
MSEILFFILGRKVAWVYGATALVAVAVLSALYAASSFGLEAYVSDQLARLPWDIAVIQQGAIASSGALHDRFKAIPGTARVEAVGIVRIQYGNRAVGFTVDGKILPSRWLTLVSSTDPHLLPPELRGHRIEAPAAAGSESVLGVQAAMVSGARGVPAQGGMHDGSELQLVTIARATTGATADADEAENHRARPILAPGAPHTLFSARVSGSPSQVDREELNKWALSTLGSLSYIPEQSVIVAVPMPVFMSLTELLDQSFLNFQGVDGQSAASPYLPEVIHVIRLQRGGRLSAWDLRGALEQLLPLMRHIGDTSRELTSFVFVNSPLKRMLTRMFEVSRLIGVATIVAAIPLLWLSWTMSQHLSRLLVTNARRLIGLLILRGIPAPAIRRTVLWALLMGGLGGGAMGLGLGLALTLAAYALLGHSLPAWRFWESGIGYFVAFFVLGSVLGLLSGRKMLARIARLTPREAVERTGRIDAATNERVSGAFVLLAVIAFSLGLYKILAWAAGEPSVPAFLSAHLPSRVRPFIGTLDAALTFVAVPLLLAGLAGLLRWRLGWFQWFMNVLSRPLLGRLSWWMTEHLSLQRSRIAATFFVTALATASALLPQVAADSYYGRALRGVYETVGSDLQIEFDLADIAGDGGPKTVAAYQRLIAPELASIGAALAAQPGIAVVAGIQQYVIPGVYLPAQSGLLLDLIADPAAYDRAIYRWEELGQSRPLSTIIRGFSGVDIAASAGFLAARHLQLHQKITLGYDLEDKPIEALIDDVVGLLPGQPTRTVQAREGYADAELDYLNFALGTDARIASSLERFMTPPLSALTVLPSRVAILAKSSLELDDGMITRLVASLPTPPQEVRWRAGERARIGRDMFASLAIENMKVLTVGGLILAASGVFIIGLANFIAERRTLSLLRLRGVPPWLLLRVSLSMFLVPVAAGIAFGGVLGAVSGFGAAEEIWALPRLYGAAGFLQNHLVFSTRAWCVLAGFALVLGAVALGFALSPLRHSVRESFKE